MLSLLLSAATAAAYNVAAYNASSNFTTGYNVSTSTEIVTAYTTYCPGPTTFTEGSSTYTVTGATTLTISDCPCTRTHTYSTAYVTVCPASSSISVNGPVASSTGSAPTLANGASKQGLSLGLAVGAVVIANML